MRNLILLAWLVLFAGCDLGTYSQRYNSRVGKMSSMANTNKDLADELVDVGGVAKIRLPKVCNNPDSARFGTGDDFFKARIPGIELEGFVSSYMGDKEAADGSWFPFQVYLFYIKNPNIEEVKKEIKTAINKVMKQTTVSWDSVKLESYDEKQYVWEMATIGVGQPFLVYENNDEKRVDLNGRLDLYATSNDNGVLVVAFRAPSSVFGAEDQSLVDGTLKSIQGFK